MKPDGWRGFLQHKKGKFHRRKLSTKTESWHLPGLDFPIVFCYVGDLDDAELRTMLDRMKIDPDELRRWRIKNKV